MNSVNSLLTISVILLPMLLIFMNYSTIVTFYEFSVPLNKAEIIPNFPINDLNKFSEIQKQNDSTCYITPYANLFCYTKPRIYDESKKDHLSSYVIGNNGINGEIHFDRVGAEGGIFTIKNMSLIDDETALFTFADKNYRIGNKDRVDYEIVEKFEFSAVVKKFDTFITHCGNYGGTGATMVQYLGIANLDNVDYFLTWHTVINSKDGLSCKYPELIQYSLKHDFREL